MSVTVTVIRPPSLSHAGGPSQSRSLGVHRDSATVTPRLPVTDNAGTYVSTWRVPGHCRAPGRRLPGPGPGCRRSSTLSFTVNHDVPAGPRRRPRTGGRGNLPVKREDLRGTMITNMPSHFRGHAGESYSPALAGPGPDVHSAAAAAATQPPAPRRRYRDRDYCQGGPSSMTFPVTAR
jgi:hypothetical protein